MTSQQAEGESGNGVTWRVRGNLFSIWQYGFSLLVMKLVDVLLKYFLWSLHISWTKRGARSHPRPHANTKCSCCGKIEAVGWTLHTIIADISKQDAKDNLCILSGGSDRKLQNVA